MSQVPSQTQSKLDERQLRLDVFQSQHEPGLRALLRLAEIKRDFALRSWRAAVGSDLVRFQTDYNAYQTIIDLVTKSPVNLPTVTQQEG